MPIQKANSSASEMSLVATTTQAPISPLNTTGGIGNTNLVNNVTNTTVTNTLNTNQFTFPAYTNGPQQVLGLVPVFPCCNEIITGGSAGCTTFTVQAYPNSEIFIGAGNFTLTFTVPGGTPQVVTFQSPIGSCNYVAAQLCIQIQANFPPITAVATGCSIQVCVPNGDSAFYGSTLAVGFWTGKDIGYVTFNNTPEQYISMTIGVANTLQPNTTDCGDCRQGRFYADGVFADDQNYLLPVFGGTATYSYGGFESDYNNFLFLYPSGYDAIVEGDFKLQKLVLGDWNTVAVLDNNDYGFAYNGDSEFPMESCTEVPVNGLTINYQGYSIDWGKVLSLQGAGQYRFLCSGLGPQDTAPGYCSFSPPFCLEPFTCEGADRTCKFEAVYCGGVIGDVNNTEQGNSWNLTINTAGVLAVPSSLVITLVNSGFPGPIMGTFNVGATSIPVNYYGPFAGPGTGTINSITQTFANYATYIAALISTVPGYTTIVASPNITITGPTNANGTAITQSYYDTSHNFKAYDPTKWTAAGITWNPYTFPDITYNNGGYFTLNKKYTVPAGDLTQTFVVNTTFDDYYASEPTSLQVKAGLIVNNVLGQTVTYNVLPATDLFPPTTFSTTLTFAPETFTAGDTVELYLRFVLGDLYNAPMHITYSEWFNENTTVVSSKNYGKLAGGNPGSLPGIVPLLWGDSVRFSGFFGNETVEFEKTQIKYQNGQIYKVRDEGLKKFNLHSASMPAWFHQRFWAYGLMASDQLYVSDYNYNNSSYQYKKYWVVYDSGYTPDYKNYSRYSRVLDIKFKEGTQFIYRQRYV